MCGGGGVVVVVVVVWQPGVAHVCVCVCILLRTNSTNGGFFVSAQQRNLQQETNFVCVVAACGCVAYENNTIYHQINFAWLCGLYKSVHCVCERVCVHARGQVKCLHRGRDDVVVDCARRDGKFAKSAKNVGRACNLCTLLFVRSACIFICSSVSVRRLRLSVPNTQVALGPGAKIAEIARSCSIAANCVCI